MNRGLLQHKYPVVVRHKPLYEPGLELAVLEATLRRLDAERWDPLPPRPPPCRHPAYQCIRCDVMIYPKR